MRSTLLLSSPTVCVVLCKCTVKMCLHRSWPNPVYLPELQSFHNGRIISNIKPLIRPARSSVIPLALPDSQVQVLEYRTARIYTHTCTLTSALVFLVIFMETVQYQMSPLLFLLLVTGWNGACTGTLLENTLIINRWADVTRIRERWWTWGPNTFVWFACQWLFTLYNSAL